MNSSVTEVSVYLLAPKYGKYEVKSKQQALHDCFTEQECRPKSNS